MKKALFTFLICAVTSCVSDAQPIENQVWSASDLALISVVHGTPNECRLLEAPRALDCDMGEWHALINTVTLEVYRCDELTECPDIVHTWFHINCDDNNECIDQAW